MPTIEELLKSMLTIPNGEKVGDRLLHNNKETWRRIPNRDSFEELGFESESEKEQWLKEWINNNPYSNI